MQLRDQRGLGKGKDATAGKLPIYRSMNRIYPLNMGACAYLC